MADKAEFVVCESTIHWVFRCETAVVHHAAPTRAASVVHEIMDGHRPAVWLSDRYSAQQGHADRQQTCWPISRATWPTPLRPETTRSPSASSCGSVRPSP